MNEIDRDLGGDSAHEEFTIAVAGRTGDIVFRPDGKAGIVLANKATAVGDIVPITTEAKVLIDAASATTFAAGADVWYDVTNKLAVAAFTTGSRPLGAALAAKTNGQTSVLVDLNATRNSGSFGLNSFHRRCTTAEINAGVELLPAIPGYKYRVRDMRMIAIGGGAATATTVDITGTQSASSVKLLAVAVAALTQSAVVRAGAANASVLADGASFVANDVNTAINASKTGSALATATAIDVFIDYILEAA